MGNLQSLNLAKTEITDAGLGHLKSLHDLRVVDITGTRVTDAGLDEYRKKAFFRILRADRPEPVHDKLWFDDD